MKILFGEQFTAEFTDIVLFIAQDKKGTALRFKRELTKILFSLKKHPKRYRKSLYIDNENFRDLTYKGYTITYQITQDAIHVITIFKGQDRPISIHHE